MKIKNSRFQLLLQIYLISLAIFTVTRTVLLVMSWQDVTPWSAVDILEIYARGLLFDSAFCTYALIVPTLYIWLFPARFWAARWHRYWAQLVAFVVLYLMLFVAIAEYLFWDEFKVRFNFIAIDYLIYRREVTDNIMQSYPVVPILAILLVVCGAIFWLLRPLMVRAFACREPFGDRSLIALVLLLFPLLAYLGMSQPLRQFTENNYINELTGNGPYQFVAAFRNNELDYNHFYQTLPVAEADRLLRGEVAEPNATFLSSEPFDIRRDITAAGKEQRLNVILVTIESLSSDFLGYFGNIKGLTPNLDRLVHDSLFFDNFYATGTRTTRGLEALTLSIPPTPGRSIVKRLGRETDQWSLGQVLGDKGYHPYFIYGGRSYFENMGSFFQGNGYAIIDQSSVPSDQVHFTNAWGMADEDLYQQAITTADAEYANQQPFFLHLMTTSNHRPYTYPDGRIDIPSGSGRSGAVKYSDYAIGQFLKQVQEKPWFRDTLFVFVADHQAGSAGKTTLPLERYHIPLWIYAPAHIKAQVNSTLASQVDVAPTLLGLLNMSYRSCFFGRDILKSPARRALIANYQYLGLYDGKEMAILEPQKVARLQKFDNGVRSKEESALRADSFLKRDISYYQGAAYVYRHRLNAWSLRNDLPVSGALHAAIAGGIN